MINARACPINHPTIQQFTSRIFGINHSSFFAIFRTHITIPLMNSHFSYDATGQLTCDGHRLSDLAAEFGTPLYIYSEADLLERANAIHQTATALNAKALTCFAVKANGNIAILQRLRDAGLGADVTSGGELFLALHAGISPEKIIFSGVGKTVDELEMALNAGIRAIHVESDQEYLRLSQIAMRMKKVANVGVRVNPNIYGETHEKMSTGKKEDKFGVSPKLAIGILQHAHKHPSMNPVAVAAHIGSNIRDLSALRQVSEFLVGLGMELRSAGIPLDYIDCGGGFAIGYGQPTPDPRTWVEAVAGPVQSAGFNLVLEPGRAVVGPSAVLLAEVQYVKAAGEKRFVVVNAGMSDLIRPTLYNAHHPVWPVKKSSGDGQAAADIVGPICETGDFLARDRALPTLATDDLIAIADAGAYGSAMSSNYNGRLRPAELLITATGPHLIRNRDRYEDLLQNQIEPPARTFDHLAQEPAPQAIEIATEPESDEDILRRLSDLYAS